MSKYDYSKVQEAIDFANEAHRGVNRKGVEIPYVTHVMEVYKVLFNMGVRDPDMLIAAILHDIIEDTPYTWSDIEKKFNSRVASYVHECSRMVDGEETLRVKYDFMQTFKYKSTSLGSVLIKIADRYVNTMDYYKEGREVYAAWYSLQAYPLYIRYHDAKNTQKLFNMRVNYVGEYVNFLESLFRFHYDRPPYYVYNNEDQFMQILLTKPDETSPLLKSFEEHRVK